MYKFNLLDKISLILVIIGALNWGLIGLFNFNLIGALLGEPVNLIGRIIYILVGAAGVDMLLLLLKMKKSFK
ncbi:DUF378 domain-containing protein [Clostridium aciditolerans]|uniref:DUF378 domain-containing protein n=1 Tax=Clostridium aciditolerans TaxID=339861 RepID=A0A934HUT4_9CLOT|nr:DUF378 domain-containing protein [Clostridium aciditolerans]MBI6874971.1 DUF378 domain-containing protein [Clostridium aciditolerans]